MSLSQRITALAQSIAVDIKALYSNKADKSDARLTDAREWSEDTVTQAEAEAGIASTRRAWTAQRVRQAINAWWQLVTSGFGRNFIAASNETAARNILQLGTSATRNVGTGAGNVMEVGAFMLGADGNPAPIDNINSLTRTEFFRWATGTSVGFPAGYGEGVYIHGTAQGGRLWECYCFRLLN